ncbi:MAG: phosphatidate cytidylyltransferase [Clostridia bacterium]|nr:phosphatidate cytidylyltransferase [Clostridia bacterium]
MLQRTISALIALPILIFAIYSGGLVMDIMALVVSLIGLYEFYHCFKEMGISPFKVIGYVSTVSAYVCLMCDLGVTFLYMTFMILLFMTMIFYVHRRTEHSFYEAVITVFGFTYITISLIHVPMLDRLDGGIIIWYPFIIAFVTDTCAYFSGRFFGKNKLIPDVSPKKTKEGAVGGVLGSMVASTLFAYLFDPSLMMFAVVAGFLGSIFSQYGDLLASKIKRFVGIKDYGNIMPGHGGILDRFDSIIVTSPFVFYAYILYTTLF